MVTVSLNDVVVHATSDFERFPGFLRDLHVGAGHPGFIRTLFFKTENFGLILNRQILIGHNFNFGVLSVFCC
jgi:hypothetical protein